MKKLLKAAKGMFYYWFANILFCFRYDRKYAKGEWFGENKTGYRRWLAPGWKMTVDAYRGCKRLNVNQNVPWPVSPRCCVIIPENVSFHPDNLNNFHSFGIYYQAFGNISIGHGTAIGPNVGIITSNHNLEDPDRHLPPSAVTIGESCWIGMNSMILPGVVLGDHTIVGASSVVTKSFPEGHCVIAGNPAKKIKEIHAK